MMKIQRIGVLGSGTVGQVLADGLIEHGYEVMRGSRQPGKLGEWKNKAGVRASLGTFAETARFGELVVLAVKGSAAEAVVGMCGAESLAGKTVIDTANPIVDAPPTNGVLALFTGPNDSLMERLQKGAPAAHFVKAFSCVGSSSMVNPDFSGLKPTMFICGNDAGAKKQVEAILVQFGWDVEDMGSAEAARAIEPLCVLWCIPGFRQNDWSHALKMLRK
jgi:8-hydroxy-5-deazaflavin:NADPH oxidoreductase